MARDQVGQAERYYVLEVNDRGEIGIWRRDGDQWTDLLPWTPSPAVRSGDAPNELKVQAVGEHLLLWVNDVAIASQTDVALGEGTVGIFVGGEGNQVLLERMLVESAD